VLIKDSQLQPGIDHALVHLDIENYMQSAGRYCNALAHLGIEKYCTCNQQVDNALVHLDI
jgi:hypothetical protein